MIKLTSAYFKSRPDTTRAQLNRRACFDEIKKSPDPFMLDLEISTVSTNNVSTFSIKIGRSFLLKKYGLKIKSSIMNNEIQFILYNLPEK